MQQAKLKFCEACRKSKRTCDSQRPSCSYCIEIRQKCAYSYHNTVMVDQFITSSRSVFTTQNARRLSSGSACETCRKRKTKCDGGSPCHYCRTNNLDCVNNIHERRLRAMSRTTTNGSNRGVTTTTSSLSMSTTIDNSNPTTTTTERPTEDATMDQIEDRLRRIERLMTAFTPTITSTNEKRQYVVRGLRHSVHGTSATTTTTVAEKGGYERKVRMEPVHNMSAFGSISPPTTTAALTTMAAKAPAPHFSMSSIPTTHHQQTTANSTLKLSVSPSSDNMDVLPSPPNSTSSVVSSFDLHQQNYQYQSSNRWKITGSIPSLMDQLSDRTFPTSAVEYTITQYPIYPLTPPLPANTSTLLRASSSTMQRPHSLS
ncbi:hypothetical protein BDF20DRAFT_836790 [Mycotypha africana]|uniref:uncharacterized protein n=1 Tax=Mycotypha africana TaxID=64632 RepID=UPI0023008773|nr:uncharacterized protein BDF20DRAFT_836790 [Mycotypha africana]KAI8975381.1 hypothetical protein BDF20DRAFT_836790 [Mycotypha africana]